MIQNYERLDDYICTYTQKRFYANNPRPEDVCLLDIAHSLSYLCRFNGHCDEFYSVARHSILCVEVARKLGYTREQQLITLFHDASEAYLSDIPRPFKQDLHDYRVMEDRVQQVIWDALGVKVTEESYKPIKMVDNILLINEIKKMMNPEYYKFPTVEKMIDVEFNLKTPKEDKEEFIQLAIDLGCKMKYE